jgi:hypothetical protein
VLCPVQLNRLVFARARPGKGPGLETDPFGKCGHSADARPVEQAGDAAFRDDTHKEMPTSRRARILTSLVRAPLRARGFLRWPAIPRALS